MCAHDVYLVHGGRKYDTVVNWGCGSARGRCVSEADCAVVAVQQR